MREIFSHFGKLRSVELAMDRVVNLPRWAICSASDSRPQSLLPAHVLFSAFTALPALEQPPADHQRAMQQGQRLAG